MTEYAVANIPSSFTEDEILGRHEWSRSTTKKVRGRKSHGETLRVPVSKFKLPKDSCKLSVDRMNFADASVLAELAKNNTTRSNPTFMGLYTLSKGDVTEADCNVQSSPLTSNPYHADILIPVNLHTADSRDALTEFARDLAYRAKFESWGD